jgi:hypothetical protein
VFLTFNFFIMKQIYFTFFSVCFGLTTVFAQTYSNGPLSTGATSSGGTAAPAGYTWSEMPATNNSIGVASVFGGTNNFALADDFVVPAGQTWQVSKVAGFAYQTNSAATPAPFNGLRVAIFSAQPTTGSTPLFGDLTTNVFGAGVDALIYRITSTAVGTTRKVWKLETSALSYTLPAGTYWLAYQVVTTNAAAAFTPPVTIDGAPGAPGANAIQSNAGTWAPILDIGNPANSQSEPQAIPFEITYSVLGTESFSENAFEVYPNPVTDQLNIVGKGFDMQSVAIKDINGRIVKNATFESNNAQMNMQDLTAGVYLVTSKANEGEITKKIIKK